MKKCNRCKESKSFDNFHKNKAMPDGLSHYCKPCRKKFFQGNENAQIYDKKYREINRQLINAKRVKSYQRDKLKIADRKKKESGNFYGPFSAEMEYREPDRPSLGFARTAAEAFLGRQREFPGMGGQKHSMKDIAGASGITNIGRSLVSRFADEPFDYSLTVRPK